MLRIHVAVLGWLALALVPAAAVEQLTLEFEPESELPYVMPSKQLYGFLLQNSASVRVQKTNNFGNLPQNGSYYVQLGSRSEPFVLTHADGDPFTVHSIDLAEYSASVNTENVVADIVATFADGSSEPLQFELDGVIDGEGPLEDFETFTFPAHWTDVVALSFNSGLLCFDNLELTGHVIPEVAPLDGFAPLKEARIVAPLPATVSQTPNRG